VIDDGAAFEDKIEGLSHALLAGNSPLPYMSEPW
jgi:hypothetical protein